MAQQVMSKSQRALHPELFAQHCLRSDTATPVRDGIRELRNVLLDAQPQMSGHFGQNLRRAIGYLWESLTSRESFERRYGPRHRADGPTGAERAQLIASLEEAGRRAEAWCRQAGCDPVQDAPDAEAARQGWPDADGAVWTPPWGALGIEPPEYWGRF